MNAETLRKIVRERFYQSLNEQGVQITAIPQEQLRAIVDGMAESLYSVLEALEQETDDPDEDPDRVPQAPPVPADPDDEVLLWRGRPYLTLGTIYELTNHRIRIARGILSNKIEEIELVRIRDTRLKQHVGERMINVGDVTILSSDETTPQVVLHNVRHPVEVRELIRDAVVTERKRRGLHYREFMGSDEVWGEE